MKKSRKISQKTLQSFCDKYVAYYTPGFKDERGLEIKSMPTKGVFHVQLSQVLGIKNTTVRKWKQLEDPRFEPIEEVYEFIKARVEDAMLNGEDKLTREYADKYYGRVFNHVNLEREEKDISADIHITLSGTDPFEEIEDEEPKN